MILLSRVCNRIFFLCHTHPTDDADCLDTARQIEHLSIIFNELGRNIFGDRFETPSLNTFSSLYPGWFRLGYALGGIFKKIFFCILCSINKKKCKTIFF